MEDKIVFIHITKTGGETVELLLDIPKNHDRAIDRIKSDDKQYKFAIVRNPYDRLVSWYSHLRKELDDIDIYGDSENPESLANKSMSLQALKNGHTLQPDIHRILALNCEFDEWAKIVLTDPAYLEPHWGPSNDQYSMLFSNDGILLVDDVYKFEDFNNSLTTILKKLDREDLISKITRTNFSFHRDYHEYYDEDTRKLVYNFFRRDFTTFGYEF
jgi:hypothetical protein